MDAYESILDILSRHADGVPQSFLYRALPFSKSYISIVLRELERRGVVHRVRIGNTYIVRLAKPFTKSFHGKRLVLGIVWSSEYLFLGHFAKMLRDSLSMDLDVKVYPNAVSATLSILMGDVDAVLSPLATQLYLYPISKSFKIVGGGAIGGGFIYEIGDGAEGVVASSELSTMDLCRAVASERRLINEESVLYFNSSQQAIEIARGRGARNIVVWHPITYEIEKMGGKRVGECIEFEETKHCCTLAISDRVPPEMVEKIATIYRQSIDVFKREPSRFLDWYSTLTGIDTALLRDALKVYRYDGELDHKSIDKLIRFMNIKIPHIQKLENAFYKI
ncbi:MAG: hypothetical protein QW348_06000 [Ignisphaera sp.]